MRLQPLEAAPGASEGARLGFGCGSLGDVLDFAGKCRIVEAAYEAGFRHFDTAPSYAHGEAEAVLATVLGGVRDKVSIVTKAGIAHPKGTSTLKRLRRLAAPIKALLPASLWSAASRKASRVAAPAGRFSPAQIEESVAESLRRLRSESLDGLLLHMVTAADLTPEALATLDGLVSKGIVRGLGTGTPVEETARIATLHPRRFQAFQVDHYWGSRTPALAQHGASLLTHRCIRTGLELLDDPGLRRAIESHGCARELQAVCGDRKQVGDLLLAAALQVDGLGMVLVSSSKPERTRQFVAVSRRDDLAPLARALNQCFDQAAPPAAPLGIPITPPATTR